MVDVVGRWLYVFTMLCRSTEPNIHADRLEDECCDTIYAKPRTCLIFFGGRKPQYLHLFPGISIVAFKSVDKKCNLRVGISSPGAASDRLATLSRPQVYGLRVLSCLGVDADIDGRVEAVLDGLADERDLQDGVVAALLGHVEEHILRVGGDGLVVGAVGSRLFDLAEEVLLDVELADVGDGAALDGVVCELLRAVVDDGYVVLARRIDVGKGRRTVEMVGTSDVVTGNHGDEAGSAVGARGLDTAKGIAWERGARAVTVAPCLNTGVDTLIARQYWFAM